MVTSKIQHGKNIDQLVICIQEVPLDRVVPAECENDSGVKHINNAS